MLNNMTTKARLFLLATLSTALILGVGFFALASIEKSNLSNLHSIEEIATNTQALMAIENAHVAFKMQVQEWKNILIRGNNPEQYKKYFGKFNEQEQAVQSYLSKAINLRKKLNQPVEKLSNILQEHGKLGSQYRDALTQFDESDPNTGKEIDKLVKGIDRPTSKGLNTISRKTEDGFVQMVDEKIVIGKKVYQYEHKALIIFTVVSVLLVIFACIYILHGLMKTLGGDPILAMSVVRRITAGDLTSPIPVLKNCEKSVLGSLSTMQSSLKTLISEIRKAANSVATDAENMKNISDNVSQASHQQNEATTTMAVTTTQISQGVEQISNHAEQVCQLAVETGDQSRSGKEAVTGAITMINKIVDSFEVSSRQINDLTEKSQEISAIVNVIKDIAEQTNLLALNAAIEAARAGEQGRGFAVVADEVRNLSERTTTSTIEITSMIEAIQQSSQEASKGVLKGAEKIELGANAVTKAGEIIDLIGHGNERLLQSVQDISSSLQDQTKSSVTIIDSVSLVADMSQNNQGTMIELNQSATEFIEMSENLQQLVAKFKL